MNTTSREPNEMAHIGGGLYPSSELQQFDNDESSEIGDLTLQNLLHTLAKNRFINTKSTLNFCAISA